MNSCPSDSTADLQSRLLSPATSASQPCGYGAVADADSEQCVSSSSDPSSPGNTHNTHSDSARPNDDSSRAPFGSVFMSLADTDSAIMEETPGARGGDGPAETHVGSGTLCGSIPRTDPSTASRYSPLLLFAKLDRPTLLRLRNILCGGSALGPLPEESGSAVVKRYCELLQEELQRTQTEADRLEQQVRAKISTGELTRRPPRSRLTALLVYFMALVLFGAALLTLHFLALHDRVGDCAPASKMIVFLTSLV